MGSFYVHFILHYNDADKAASALLHRSAFLIRTGTGNILIAEKEAESQSRSMTRSFTRNLSQKLHCPVLSIGNHDDDILWYYLAVNGRITDEYDSFPAYFNKTDNSSPPSEGKAKVLCAAFGKRNAARVEEILRKSSDNDDGYLFASDRHKDLAKALGIPAFSVGLGFNNILEDGLPDGISGDEIIKIG